MPAMDLILFSNELLGDDLADVLRRLHRHSKDNDYKYLSEFLQQATLAFRDEVGQLSQINKSQIPYLESILELCNHEHLRSGNLSGAIEGVILTVLQIGLLIGHYECNSNTYSFEPTSCSLVGLGIGLLSATAVSMSPTLAHLPAAGTEAVRCAFRLGVLVDDISQNLEARPLDGSKCSWAYVVTGIPESEIQRELDILNKTIAEPSKLFISASNSRSLTVSGPPSILKLLFRESNILRSSKYAALPVFSGMCHAPHIYNRAHAAHIIDTTPTRRLQQTHLPILPVLSTETGRTLELSSSHALLEDAVLDILTRSIRLDSITNEVLHQTINSPRIGHISIHAFNVTATNNFPDLQPELDKKTIPITHVSFLSWIKGLNGNNPITTNPADSPIAIVGMACRFPGGADDLDSFWELLENGRDVHRTIPPDRFNVDTHYDPTGKMINSTLTPFGCFINEPGLFDASFFNMSAREALETDPMHRLALVTAYEALERSGFVPNRTPASDVKRVGTFYGQASDDYREVNTAQDIGTYFIPGGCRAFAPGRISYFFGFSGPSFSCDTACSSSLATIQQACTTLWAGDADTIVAGGLNVLTNSDAFAGLGRGHFLSPTGNCKTWDSGADGYCRADGVGSVVLKRLEDAEADNDNILGVILAAATNHSGEAISITHPHAGAQSDLFTKVVNRSGVNPLDVSYVEFHGTGTQAGDSTEMESVLNIFAPTTRRRTATQPLHIGAVKSNVGHGESAAGVMALIKVLSMLKNDLIPPHIGIKNTINPVIPKDLAEKRNVHIPLEKKSWSHASHGRKRLAVVNNFSAAGGNTTILLEEGPTRPDPILQDSRASQVLVVSAKSRTSLTGNIELLISYLRSNPDVSLANLSYTTCARRMHHPLRVAVVASTCDEMQQLLTKTLETVERISPITSRSTPQVAFTFAGQGSLYIGAGKKLYQDCPEFALQLQQYNLFCKLHGFPDIVSIIDGSDEGSDVTPLASSLAIVCVEMALANLWTMLGIHPSIVIGHSLGEYAALHVAGVLSASDTIYLVGKRAQIVARVCETGSHSMLAVRATADQISQCLRGMPFEYACRNSKVENVLAGSKTEIDAARQCLQDQGYKCHELDVPFAFHSAQMDPVLDEFEAVAARVIFNSPNIPVISPLRSSVVFDAKTFNARYLRDATRRPVEFVAALEIAQKMQLVNANTAWIDVGAHPICSSFIRGSIPGAKVIVSSLNRREDNWTTLSNSCAVLHSVGIPIDWKVFHRPFAACHRLLDLPKYSWSNKNYWIQYNGTWALTKGNDSAKITPPLVVESPLETSSVHHVINLDIREPWEGSMVVESDVVRADFLEAAWGHQMNNCAVVTSSIHADIAFTIAKFMHESLGAETPCHMNITKLEVLKGLIANEDTSKPQLIQIKAFTDLRRSHTELHWYNAGEESHFASATVEYGNNAIWLTEWNRIAHLVTSRIESLEQLEKEGSASKLSKNMAYKLFANLVNYSEKYRGIQSVIIKDLEAVARVKLTEETSGIWTVPPYFIDSVCHLAGLIMNGGDASETRDHFYVTPGWESMRFARALVAGQSYLSYVKMRPADSGFWIGDVYILQDNIIIGMVGGILFRRFPRSLLNTLFSPPDKSKHTTPSTIKDNSARPSTVVGNNTLRKPEKFEPEKPLLHYQHKQSYEAISTSNHSPFDLAQPQANNLLVTTKSTSITTGFPDVLTPPTSSIGSSMVCQAMAIIAREAALENLAELEDDASFVNLGIDSLLSLVLSEKFREELDIEVTGAQFLECPTIGEFKGWLQEHF